MSVSSRWRFVRRTLRVLEADDQHRTTFQANVAAPVVARAEGIT